MILSKQVIAAFLALAACIASTDAQCQTIAEIACGLDDFSTLCTAVTQAGLADALSGGEWTVFAPNNAAFAELGDTLDAVLADNDILTDILLFHAVDEELFADHLECKHTVKMANGDESRTVCKRGGRIFQKGSGNSRDNMPEIIGTDVGACNGVIHIVDAVMLPGSPPPVEESPEDPPTSPEDCNSIAEIACTLDDFSTLCTAVTQAGLADALSDGEWTVFAPTNAAFAELGDTLDAVLADNDLLTDILLFHAVAGEVFAKDLGCKHTVEMANGGDSRTVCQGGKIYQKGSGNSRSNMPEITGTDVEACNGVIHIVDAVMLP